MMHATSADDGYITVEWMAALILLVLPVILVVSVAPAWAGRHEAAAAAAREGARAAITASTGAAAQSVAVATAQQVLADRGVTARPEISVVVPTGGLLPRTGEISVTVSLPTPPIGLGPLGEVGSPTVTGTHIRALDPHRSR